MIDKRLLNKMGAAVFVGMLAWSGISAIGKTANANYSKTSEQQNGSVQLPIEDEKKFVERIIRQVLIENQQDNTKGKYDLFSDLGIQVESVDTRVDKNLGLKRALEAGSARDTDAKAQSQTSGGKITYEQARYSNAVKDMGEVREELKEILKDKEILKAIDSKDLDSLPLDKHKHAIKVIKSLEEEALIVGKYEHRGELNAQQNKEIENRIKEKREQKDLGLLWTFSQVYKVIIGK